MKFEILKTYEQVDQHIDTVRQAADRERSAFGGLLPPKSYRQQASLERLWVVMSAKGEYAGHLMFGGSHSSLKIWQLTVDPRFRGHGLAKRLVEELVEYGESQNFLQIKARVAAELQANGFWESSKFSLLRQERGKGKNPRTINIRVRLLDTPSLLQQAWGESEETIPQASIRSFGYPERPISFVPSFVLDLAIFFDVVKKRRRTGREASSLIASAFSNNIILCVTSEFIKELERNTLLDRPDPVLEFAKHLPALPSLDEVECSQLVNDLRSLVFPERSRSRRHHQNDESDLKHLAACIHHKVSGFVTTEKAILRGARKIKDDYGLEVVSPLDLTEPERKPIAIPNLLVSQSQNDLEIRQMEESERKNVELLLSRQKVSSTLSGQSLNPGSSRRPRQRIYMKEGNEIIGFASWDIDTAAREKNFFLFVDESSPSSIQLIDHAIENCLIDNIEGRLTRINLFASLDQAATRETAIRRGFATRKTKVSSNYEKLTKLSFKGPVTKENWSDFRSSFLASSDYELPIDMPSFGEFAHTGIIVKTSNRKTFCMKLFDLETLLSPALFLCSGRQAILVPIRKAYAEELLNDFKKQESLLPSKEARLFIEKAYFKSTKNAKAFLKGMPLVFYVSGKAGGCKQAVGYGRITYSQLLTLAEIKANLFRQGVLSDEQLKEISAKDGKLHAITFDNFTIFPKPIAFGDLKRYRIASDANLVTAQRMSDKQFTKLVNLGFE
ncbi:MAG: GNAT family N-acetyltransferase [Thermoleophilia bacterium]